MYTCACDIHLDMNVAVLVHSFASDLVWPQILCWWIYGLARQPRFNSYNVYTGMTSPQYTTISGFHTCGGTTMLEPWYHLLQVSHQTTLLFSSSLQFQQTGTTSRLLLSLVLNFASPAACTLRQRCCFCPLLDTRAARPLNKFKSAQAQHEIVVWTILRQDKCQAVCSAIGARIQTSFLTSSI